ncbi:M16 family metallopeptidase [Pontibacter vulgaris]|uniref:M16 family metallopeptidase n=1 Tax=Pontibacter vulgaris TaxID=2905679 RepID=UPI001FA814DF|nr:pitrilysin family protein [Pontibacter vulgaris]
MLDRKKAPATYEIDAVSLPSAEVTKLGNGARLHIIENKTQPVIRLDFVFKAGKWYEPATGISDLTSKMLLEGTTTYTAKQIANKVAFYGASFESNHGYDRVEYTLYCLSKYLKELLPLVLDVLQNPTFPEGEFELLKQRTIQNIKVQRQKNAYLATNSFTKLIYGANHPYVFGYEETALNNISLDELKSFYKQQLSTQGMEVFACGDLNTESNIYLKQSIDALQLTDKSIIDNGNKTINLNSEAKYNFVDLPNSIQSSIRVGKHFPSIQHPDYLKLTVVNEILGGYFGSRLMRNIREDKGYTYGIYSAMSPKEHDTLFYIGTDVNYEVTENTLAEIRKEIELLQKEAVSTDELDVVKNYMLGKFLNDIATIFDQCDKYKHITLNNLSSDHFNNLLHTIRTIDQNEVQNLAQQYLSLEELSTAIAGKK